MRVHVDQDRCIGAGQCVRALPEIFDQRDEDGVVVLLVTEAPDDLLEAVRVAVNLCPAQAIAVEDSQPDP